MEPKNLYQYLVQWTNKAVNNGGFTAQEARDGLNALDALARAADPTIFPQGNGQPEKPEKAKKAA